MLGKINFLNIDFPKRWSKKGDVENLDFKKAKKFIKYLRTKHKGYVSFDTETESLAKKFNRLVSIQFSIDDETGFVICLDKPFTDFTQSQSKEIKQDLKELFEDKDTGITWIGHNAQFDVCQVCNQLGVKDIARPIIDNMLFIHLLDENRIKQKVFYDRHGHLQKMSQALKAVCREFFDFTLYDKEAIEARGSNNLLLLPKDKFIEYAGMDGYITFRVFSYLKLVADKYEYWEKAEKLLIRLLSPALKMLSWVSSNGFYVDMKQLKFLISKDSPIMERLDEIKESYKKDPTCIAVNNELYKGNNSGMTSTFGMSTPWVLNLNKPKHRLQLFYFSKKGFQLEPVADKKAKSPYGTGKAFQQKYAKTNNVVKLFQEEQGLKKLKTSYLDPIWETMTTQKDSQDGRIRADFVMNGTVTGRLCSRNPNLQQIPRSDTLLKKQIKNLYCAEPVKEGEEKKILVQADFCANEIRFWAAISSDPYLCNAFNESFKKGCQFRENPDDEKLEEEAHLQGDIHKQTASMMYKVPLKEVTKNLRQSAKSLSLGIMYQRGVKSVASQLGITEEEAQKLFDKFFEHFTVGVKWANKQKEDVKKYGYIESPLGRRRRLGSLIIDGNKLLEKSREEGRGKGKGDWIQANKLIGRAERQAVNSPIQGLASDLALIALSLLHQYIIKHNLRTIIVNSVHDSVVMEIPESEIYEMGKIVREIFTEKSRKYAYKYFGWKMPTHIDIDFEVGQFKNYICKKCGAYLPRYKKVCDNKDENGKVCGCTDLIKHRLNMGYGTLLGWNETKQELKKLRKGF